MFLSTCNWPLLVFVNFLHCFRNFSILLQLSTVVAQVRTHSTSSSLSSRESGLKNSTIITNLISRCLAMMLQLNILKWDTLKMKIKWKYLMMMLVEKVNLEFFILKPQILHPRDLSKKVFNCTSIKMKKAKTLTQVLITMLYISK